MKTRIQVTSEKARAIYCAPGLPPMFQQVCQAYRLSIREFASIFEISKTHADDIIHEKRLPSLYEAIRICRYFECTVEEMFGWRFDDDGKRSPLLVIDRRTGKSLRFNRNSGIKGAVDLVKKSRG